MVEQIRVSVRFSFARVLPLMTRQNTRMNDKVAVELVNDIVDLLKSIDDIIKQLKARVEPVTQSLSIEQRTRVNIGSVKKPTLFQVVVEKLHE
jgi:hypothetical protein